MALFLKKKAVMYGRNLKMVTEKLFDSLPSGEKVTAYRLENSRGAYAEVLDYGAILRVLCVPDRNGDLTDVVL